MDLQELIEKYKKEWDKYGMGASISYSKVVADLESINSMSECERQPVDNNEQGGNKCNNCKDIKFPWYIRWFVAEVQCPVCKRKFHL
jgi:hypothetical protein